MKHVKLTPEGQEELLTRCASSPRLRGVVRGPAKVISTKPGHYLLKFPGVSGHYSVPASGVIVDGMLPPPEVIPHA